VNVIAAGDEAPASKSGAQPSSEVATDAKPEQSEAPQEPAPKPPAPEPARPSETPPIVEQEAPPPPAPEAPPSAAPPPIVAMEEPAAEPLPAQQPPMFTEERQPLPSPPPPDKARTQPQPRLKPQTRHEPAERPKPRRPTEATSSGSMSEASASNPGSAEAHRVGEANGGRRRRQVTRGLCGAGHCTNSGAPVLSGICSDPRRTGRGRRFVYDRPERAGRLGRCRAIVGVRGTR
jgi:hypothetical protein